MIKPTKAAISPQLRYIPIIMKYDRTVLITALLTIMAGIAHAETPAQKLSDAAMERTKHQVLYDGSYRKISYPGGDVPDNVGVCSDVVIRAYRKLGVDLQVEVHKDMKSSFDKYPNNWGLTRTDSNIDHRRVPNLETFLTRKGASLPVTSKAQDYQPGDLVTWRIGGTMPHIGIVVEKKTLFGRTPMVVHNAGMGPRMENVLFAWPMIGHYRYLPETEGE